MSLRLLKRACALALICGFLTGCSALRPTEGDGLVWITPDQLAEEFRNTDMNATADYENAEVGAIITKELGNVRAFAAVSRNALESARNDPEINPDALAEMEADFASLSAYEINLKNLLMLSDEGAAANANSLSHNKSGGKTDCIYHLQGFHSGDAFNIFEPETEADSTGHDEAEDAGPDIGAAKALDSADGYEGFRRLVYQSTNNFIDTTYTRDVTDHVSGITVPRTYTGKFTLEDDNILNYLRYAYHRMNLTRDEYLRVYGLVNPDNKNKRGGYADQGGRSAAAYLPPPEYVGTFGGAEDAQRVLEFFTNNLFSTYSDSLFSNALTTDNTELYAMKRLARTPAIKDDMGYYSNLMCTNHLMTYHVFTTPLIEKVGRERFDEFLRFYGLLPEKINIRQFVEYFHIPKEEFKALTLDPESGIAPYHADMVYADLAVCEKYFRMGTPAA